MNKLLVLLGSVLLSTSTLAMSGHVGISTDYMWRGQTQTDHGMAVNFGIEQDLGQGFYISNPRVMLSDKDQSAFNILTSLPSDHSPSSKLTSAHEMKGKPMLYHS